MSYTDWIVAKLNNDNQEVDSATALGDSLIEIHTKKGKTIIVGTIDSSGNITNHEVYKTYVSGSKKPNIVIAKHGSVWDGSAIDYARQQHMGWGGMGEISSAFDTSHYVDIQKREYKFVEDGLRKHSRVAHLERIYDRVFKIHRSGNLPPLTISLVNSYELNGDDVRHAIDIYGKVDAILKTNPNGSPTGNAYSAAEQIGAEILTWRELLGRLNRK